MKIKALHPRVTNKKTYLVSKALSGQKDLIVLNGADYAVDDFVVIGTSGEKGTEIGKIASKVGNTLTLVANLASTHAENIPISVVDYDQVSLWKSATEGGEYAMLGSVVDIDIDNEYTLLEDTSSIATDFYKIKYYNSEDEEYSEFSDAIAAVGFSRYALAVIQDNALALAKDEAEKTITRDMITEWVNQWKDDLASEIAETNEKYFLVLHTYALIIGTQEYVLEGNWRKIQKVEVNLAGGDHYRSVWEDIEDDLPDFTYSPSNPRHYITAGSLGFRPAPTATGTAKVWQEDMPADLEDDGDELVAPLRYYLQNMYDYLEYKILKQFRKYNEADSAWAKFENGKDKIIEQINSRVLDQNREVKNDLTSDIWPE